MMRDKWRVIIHRMCLIWWRGVIVIQKMRFWQRMIEWGGDIFHPRSYRYLTDEIYRKVIDSSRIAEVMVGWLRVVLISFYFPCRLIVNDFCLMIGKIQIDTKDGLIRKVFNWVEWHYFVRKMNIGTRMLEDNTKILRNWERREIQQ